MHTQTTQHSLIYFYKQAEGFERKDECLIMKKERLVRNFLTVVSCRLKCPICYDVFVKPRRLLCGHTFCKPCLQQLCSTQHHKDPEHILSCPLCRTPIQVPLIGYDQIAKKIIDDLQVSCTVFGCPWQGKCSQLAKHHEKCPMRALIEEEMGEVQEVAASSNHKQKEPSYVVSILSEDEEQSIEQGQLELPQRISAEEYFYQEVKVQRRLVTSRGVQTIPIPIEIAPQPPRRRRRRRRFSKQHGRSNQNGQIIPKRRRRRTKQEMEALRSMKEEPIQPQTQQQELKDIQQIYNSMGFNFYQSYEEVNKVKKRLVVDIEARPQQVTQRW